MKKIVCVLLVITALSTSCKKETSKCYYTNGKGDYRDTKPSDQEIQQQATTCGCPAEVWYKECP